MGYTISGLIIVASAIVGAFAFRLRGGAYFPFGSTTVARLVWAVIMTAMGMWCSWSLWMVIAFPLFFVAAIPGWFDAFDMGRSGGSYRRDFKMMMLRGLVWTVPPSLAPLALGLAGVQSFSLWWVFAICGVAAPVIYEITWRIPALRIHNAVGEFLFGLWLGGWWAFVLL